MISIEKRDDMVKHVVMWKIEGKDGKTKEQALVDIKKQLEGLNGQIEGMQTLEVGINYNESATAYDAVLTSIHESKEALQGYQKHEKHQHVANTYVRPFTVARVGVDFEY